MAKTAKCPDCGEMFDPRGLLSHRAARHGASAPPARQPAPSTTAAAATVASKTSEPEGNGPASSTDAAPPRSRSIFEILGDLWGGKA